ncbi:rod shape-determining protein MreD [Clostridium cylindrosporum]|uniref:Rod shape-determining protein MreD n=1 Tax=Clostridium cylindrosporum DSM 605 TaxID=1121307 RepID=A0A0J8DB64_CLOCY|nr:rod shape-determining protein MreD [Clostridium cylindrosporum]KMT21539.1 rod shape-determining protein MreD [Clostridium cylindrosporum DSM 605]
MYKKIGLIVFLSILVNILQQTIFSNIKIFAINMDIVLTFIICYSLIREDVECVMVALLCGLIRDSFFPGIFGLNTIVYLVTAYILCQIERKIYKDALLIPMLSAFVFTVLKGILYYAYLYTASIQFEFVSHFMYVVPIEAILNSIISIIVFRFVTKIDTIKFMQQEWKF